MKHYHFSKEDTSVAKLIAIILMVLHHLFGFTDRIPSDYMYKTIHMWHGKPIEALVCSSFSLCVAFYLFLSGYGTFLSTRKCKNLSKTIAERIRRLLILIWEVMLIYVPIDYLLGVEKVNITAKWSIKYDMQSIILSMLGFEKYNGEWWYIMPYIFLLMLTPIFIYFFRRKKSDFFTDFIIVFGIALFAIYGYNKLVTYGMFENIYYSEWGPITANFIHFLPIYLMGMLYAKCQVFSYYDEVLPSGKIRYVVLIIIACMGFYMRYKLGSSYDFFLVGPVVFATVIIVRKIPLALRVAEKTARYNTLIWLIHSFYIYQFGQKFVYSFKYPILIFVVEAVISFASAVAVYWLFAGIKKCYKKIRTK